MHSDCFSLTKLPLVGLLKLAQESNLGVTGPRATQVQYKQQDRVIGTVLARLRCTQSYAQRRSQ